MVYKAKDIVTNDEYAIKRIKLGDQARAKEGVDISALREIKMLLELASKSQI